MRSLIIEGIDASGKDTVIRSLIAYKHWATPPTLHERASTSLGGPVTELGAWVANDALEMHRTGPWLYNRHPLVSEPIYGPYRRVQPGVREPFNNPAWLDAWRRVVARESILVMCCPPYSTVVGTMARQGPTAHMPGVYENALPIYREYNRLVWPGITIRYDYTVDTVDTLINLIKRVEL
jgi:hypothetical protein